MAMDEEQMVRYRLSNCTCSCDCDGSVLNVYVIGGLELFVLQSMAYVGS